MAGDWVDSGDNAWQMTAATIVGMQSVPGLVILYGSIVKKKWAVNSAFMALYAFAAVLVVWALFAFDLSFNSADTLVPLLWGKPSFKSLGQHFLFDAPNEAVKFPNATFVFFQFVFAAITLILIAGSLLGRMNFHAWMLFVPLWLIFSYSIGAYSLWTGLFHSMYPTIDFAGGYVIHLSSGVAGFTAAYWVGPRLTKDRERFPPNNVLLMLGGAGMLWLGWSGFNGGAPYSAGLIASLAVLNTHICAATSLLMWLCLDMMVFGKPSVIGAVQGMITGLVCITPGAGVVQPWAAILMGMLSGSVPWLTMMVVHKRSALLQKVDDTMGVFHTHAVAGLLGGILSGIFGHPTLCVYFFNSDLNKNPNPIGFIYSFNRKYYQHVDGYKYTHTGPVQILYQIFAAMFIIVLNVVMTSIICLVIRVIVPLRMPDDALEIGDDAAHGEEAYALWGDGEKLELSKHGGSQYEFEDMSGLPTTKKTAKAEA
ncbi:ammonium transporter 3 member 1-like [Cryptomeria japonica]|uniref:ammonium transporter 3 member 1-like n=1 Tax=Cryptomeria japonica TaxID=3369 RepID=UPI0025ABFCB7|nr:ammonium transporter 3 member 1-like [Cryptomeria japonica]